MKYILSPSILSADFGNLQADIEKAAQGGAEYLHIDVMDGVFVPQISIGMPVIKSIRKETDLVFDVHLMITKPERYIEDFAQSGADLITFHLEAAEDPLSVINQIHKAGKKAGISIKPGTPVSQLWPYLDQADMVLVMSVEPGFGGQKYMDSCTQKIRDVRAEIDRRKLSTDLEVDGGVNEQTIQTVLDAGANVIVAGSAVYRGDAKANTEKLMRYFPVCL